MGQGQQEFDRHMMTVAIAMARRGLGTTWPNPSVGAVIADEMNQTVIARGWTAPTGRPHAEPIALDRAGPQANGKTMYVTLEPCSHHGKTPPCCDAIIAAGLSRVVAAQTDPDPRVSGRGLKKLRQAGIKTERGLLANEARNVTIGHILRVSERRPFVQLKMALDAGGNVARGGGGKPAWVTGETARAHGHLLRAQSDAILIGAKTLQDDDPQLTCRLPGLETRSPVRVILSGKTLPSLESRVVQSAGATPTWIVPGQPKKTNPLVATRKALEHAGCELIDVTLLGDQVWLPSVAEALVSRGITRLLVEGGPSTWRSFSKAGLVDEVVIFMAQKRDEPRRQPSRVLDQAIARYLPDTNLDRLKSCDLGSDTMHVFAHK